MSAAIPILSEAEVSKIAAIASRLQSDHDGEVVNAGRMLVRSLDKHNLRLGDVIIRALKPQPIPQYGSSYRPEPAPPLYPHQRQAQQCMGWPDGVISRWEEEFVSSILRTPRLSPKQKEILGKVVAKVNRYRAASQEAF